MAAATNGSIAHGSTPTRRKSEDNCTVPWQQADQRLLTVPPAGNVHCILMREAK
ncbi:MAG: hypothetical protein V5B35_16765 [Candidatus Accumulibacter necessarius]|uniref:hypothetical protein n=1 Tax=Candidatus Accumulibacter necessarius TaxID=2954386 RepID=UPI002FC3CA91